MPQRLVWSKLSATGLNAFVDPRGSQIDAAQKWPPGSLCDANLTNHSNRAVKRRGKQSNNTSLRHNSPIIAWEMGQF
jgi:hypothetical protein